MPVRVLGQSAGSLVRVNGCMSRCHQHASMLARYSNRISTPRHFQVCGDVVTMETIEQEVVQGYY